MIKAMTNEEIHAMWDAWERDKVMDIVLRRKEVLMIEAFLRAKEVIY